MSSELTYHNKALLGFTVARPDPPDTCRAAATDPDRVQHSLLAAFDYAFQKDDIYLPIKVVVSTVC